MTRVKRTKELLHTDIIKPISPIDYNKTRFIVYNIDDAFRVHFKECIKEKEETSKAFRTWTAYLKNYTEHSVQRIHLDNSKEYTKLGAWTFEKDISIKPTVSYSPEMNGLAKISNKIIVAKARFILIDAELSKEL